MTSEKKAGVTAKTVGQKKYVDAIRNHDVTFGIGPAGTGKTYLAVAMAPGRSARRKGLSPHPHPPRRRSGRGARILPGDLYEKIMPYLRPLHDALHDMLSGRGSSKTDGTRHHRDRAAGLHARPHPHHAFIILDEAQNSTLEQMFMFLTRLGVSSKAVVTGDETQIRPAATQTLGAAGGAPGPPKDRRDRHCRIHPARHRPPPAGCSASSPPTKSTAAKRSGSRRGRTLSGTLSIRNRQRAIPSTCGACAGSPCLLRDLLAKENFRARDLPRAPARNDPAQRNLPRHNGPPMSSPSIIRTPGMKELAGRPAGRPGRAAARPCRVHGR